MNNSLPYKIFITLLPFIIILLSGCDRYSDLKKELKPAEILMKDKTDSSHNILNQFERKAPTIHRDTKLAKAQYALELTAAQETRAKKMLLWIGLCGICLLAVAIVYLYSRNRTNRLNRIIADNYRIKLILEKDALHIKNQNLELEKRNVELEYEKQKLAFENLQLHALQLEKESERLNEILRCKKVLDKPIEDAIKERIEMLNTLFAKEISLNDTYTKPYDEWINQLIQDKNTFMNSTRLAFKASHPKFIEYLESHGLTEFEINYLCLYAIGLRGKEIGEYIQLKRHYNISSDIRRKLGINEHETNIGIYIRRLMKKL